MFELTLWQCIALIGCLVYLIRSLFFIVGLAKQRRQCQRILNSPSEHMPAVTVVVPARNEEHSIGTCLDSLLKSDYPTDKLNILVVNDESTDRTGDIVAEYERQYPNRVRSISPEMSESAALRGKTRALHAGLMCVNTEFALMTDADCTVTKEWVTGMVRLLSEPGVAMACGFTVVRESTFPALMQLMEWLFNHSLASGGVALGHPLGCFGNNIGINMHVYRELGGYPNIPFSVTEDLALLQSVAKRGYQIRYAPSYRLKVETGALHTLRAFMHQLHRWTTGGQGLGWRAWIFVLSSVSFFVAVGVSALVQWWPGVVLACGIRLLGDATILFMSMRWLNLLKYTILTPVGVLFFICLEFVVPFLLFKRRVEWKGRTF